MATIIKLVLALALLVAAIQGARATLANYQYQDAVEQMLLFSPDAPDDEIVERAVALAADYNLPVDADSIVITQRNADRIVEISYTAAVDFLPGIVAYPVTFTPAASVRLLTTPRR